MYGGGYFSIRVSVPWEKIHTSRKKRNNVLRLQFLCQHEEHSLSRRLRGGSIWDWWWVCPWCSIAYACSIHKGHLILFWQHPWINVWLGYVALCPSFDVVLVHSGVHYLHVYSLGCSQTKSNSILVPRLHPTFQCWTLKSWFAKLCAWRLGGRIIIMRGCFLH